MPSAFSGVFISAMIRLHSVYASSAASLRRLNELFHRILIAFDVSMRSEGRTGIARLCDDRVARPNEDSRELILAARRLTAESLLKVQSICFSCEVEVAPTSGGGSSVNTSLSCCPLSTPPSQQARNLSLCAAFQLHFPVIRAQWANKCGP